MPDLIKNGEATKADDLIRRRELYDKHLAQAWADQQASSDAFDNNLLTFSSAALGLSISFIKDIVPLASSENIGWLFVSWVSFATCIIVTIASFQFGVLAQRAHSENLRRYYLDCNEEYLDRRTVWSCLITLSTVIGSLCFTVGLVSTLVFACCNISHIREVNTLKKQKAKDTMPARYSVGDARPVVRMTPAKNNLAISSNQNSPVQEERGRQPAKMTPIQPTQPSTQPGQLEKGNATSNPGNNQTR